MEIKINRVARGVYDIIFDKGGVRATLDDLKILKAELDRVLAPEEAAKQQARHRAFMMKLVSADDAGIQALLRRASHDDAVVLIAAAEEMEELKAKLYGNMTEKSVNLFVEDLLFKYADGVPEEDLAAAMKRLADTARKLEADGALTFGAASRTAQRS